MVHGLPEVNRPALNEGRAVAKVFCGGAASDRQIVEELGVED